ncbi:MAG TPA: hypothetical protein VHO47_00180 [Candidatus Babeliales bacterium]|nr:hypothetical protein [Candidatus Babeliales bacterium]
MKKMLYFFLFFLAQYSFTQEFLFPNENGSEKWSQQFVHWKKIEIKNDDPIEFYDAPTQKELPKALAGSYYQVAYETVKINDSTAHVLYLIPTEESKSSQPIFLYKYVNSSKNKIAGTLDLKSQDFNPNIVRAAVALADKESRLIYHKQFGTRKYKKVSDSGLDSAGRSITFCSLALFKNYYLTELIRTENGEMKLVAPYSEINWLRIGVTAFSFLAPAAFYYMRWRSQKR